jgi:hypothetical protein
MSAEPIGLPEHFRTREFWRGAAKGRTRFVERKPVQGPTAHSLLPFPRGHLDRETFRSLLSDAFDPRRASNEVTAKWLSTVPFTFGSK